MDTHFILRGALNVPMEAFQGFCRAKTNFYIFEKIGKGRKANTPTWFKDGYVWVSNAPTIGLNKDGLDLFVVDESGRLFLTFSSNTNSDLFPENVGTAM